MTTITDQINSGSLAFTAWHDPLAATGFPTYSDETLVYLTPILGPSSVLVLHRIAWYHASGIAVWIADVDQFKATFGMGTSDTRLRLTLARLESFGMIRTAGELIEVRTRIPKFPHRWIDRLPAYLADVFRHGI